MGFKQHKKIWKIMGGVFLLGMAAIIYYAASFLEPEKLKSLVVDQLEKNLNLPVAVGNAHLNWGSTLNVNLDDVVIGTPESMLVRTRYISATFPWSAIFNGNWEVSRIILRQPEAKIHLEKLPVVITEESKRSLPPIELDDGDVTLFSRNHTLQVGHINGHLDRRGINLDFNWLDGKAQLLARRSGTAWQSGLKLENLNLAKLKSQVNGKLDLKLNIQGGHGQQTITAKMSAQNLEFTGGKPIPEISATASLLKTGHQIQLTELGLTSPFFSLNGTGELTGKPGADLTKDGTLSIMCSTNAFDYNTLVDHLPLNILPEYLVELLHSQIRDGQVRLDTLGYKGPVALLTAGDQWFPHFFLSGELADVSYSAPHGPQRITGLTGEVKVQDRDLIFKHITGQMGQSRLGSVDLSFPDLLAPDTRLLINVELEMAAADFVDTWRAGMYPKEGYDLLNPLSKVQGGTITAAVSFREAIDGGPRQVEGQVSLRDCTFAWNDDHLSHVSAKATVETYGAPVQINLSGTVNGLMVDALDLQLKNPFGSQTYVFNLKTARLPQLGAFSLSPDTNLMLTGTGDPQKASGTVRVSTAGFQLFDKRFGLQKGVIRGKGKFRADFRNERRIAFPGLVLKMPDGRLNLTSRIAESGGNLDLKGTLNVVDIDRKENRTTAPFKGGIDLELNWDSAKPSKGHLACNQLTITPDGHPLVVDGLIQIKGPTLSAEKLAIQHSKGKAYVAGTLTTEPQLSFTGDILVDGLVYTPSTSTRTSTGSALPENLTVNAHVKLIKPELYGIPFDTGGAYVTVKNRTLSFQPFSLKGLSCNIEGHLTLPVEKAPEFDIELDIRNSSLEKYLATLYPEKNVIDGYMRLQGHLHGSTEDLNGKLSFAARDGHTRKASLISKIFGALNVYKIIKSRELNLTNKRFAYNFISTTCQIKNNVASFNDFYLDSDSLQFSAVGTYNIKQKQINAVVGVQPLETLDRAVSAIPVLGWVLTGDGDKLIVVSLKVEGDVEAPSISLAPVESVSKSASETLLRVLEIPNKIIQNSKELFPDKKTGS